MSTKTVSIVIPAYNEKAYLPAALESMHRQVKAMNRQVELLLIDNNSTDDTSRIAREFGATVIEERRQGYVYAVARGLQCAHGDIVIVTDADVVVAEDWLARIMDAFEDPCIAMVSGSLFMKGASPILDAVTYHAALAAAQGCSICASGPASAVKNQTLGMPAEVSNAYTVSARGTKVMAFVCAFSATPLPSNLPTCAETKVACAARWEKHWTTGGAIDLSASKDARWQELERRIVLSQYLMAAMSAGSWPSSENGLLGIDPWRGQFHMEMVWWHLAHYALWDRWDQADQALGCYRRFAPAARELAAQLGYKGLKWQKSVGPEGRTAPWVGNQVLLWKQPHPIFFAELEYRLRPSRDTLDKWADIVQGTAEHMADYPTKDETTGIYSLTPAMPPSEQGITRDTVFDLAYWRWGLDKAQEWRQRRGLAREPHWDEVRRNLAPLPVVDGVFVHSTEWTDTYTKRAWEHPDPVGVLGMLPPMTGVDGETARRTVAKVWTTWDWNRCWGWDFPWMAMAAARTGQAQIAVDALLKDNSKNSYSIEGINGGWYLPGNGGLLYAVAMMAAGWDGAPERPSPGFPDDGSWVVKWEGLKKAP